MRITNAQNELLSSIFGKYNRNRSYVICESGNSTAEGFFGNFTAYIFRKGVYQFANCNEEGYSMKRVA